MSGDTTQAPLAAEGMIPKAEIATALTTAGFPPDITTGIENWLAEQPGDSVPQEAFMLQLAEMAEIENHLATTMGDLADEVQNLAAENQRLDDQAGIAELKIQRDALAQMQQYAATAEQIVTVAEAQTTQTQAGSKQPIAPSAAAPHATVTSAVPDAVA